MEKKSVIYIVIDALCQKSLDRKIGDQMVMPFLNSLAKRSVTYSHMYAQAPYTEASEVSLFTGGNTLDCGGYLFGNGTAGRSVFLDYADASYETMYTFSPYVYSKSYLSGVKQIVYCRFFSIEPLISYRLGYYRDQWLNGRLGETAWQVCCLLLEEAFETWCAQADAFFGKDDSVAMLMDWIPDETAFFQICKQIKTHQERFLAAKKAYVEELFNNWQNHEIRNLNKAYGERKSLRFSNALRENYQSKLEACQARYSKIAKKQLPDMNYLLGMPFRNINGVQEMKDTARAYLNYYRNQNLAEYLSSINEKSKPDVSFNRMLDNFYDRIAKAHNEGKQVFAWIQPQDFHLPSLFHSLDTDDFELNCREMEEALTMLDAMDATYRGNVIADLSARYCDTKLSCFYDQLCELLGDRFVFVVTADHGYPCYENPPRAKVYNQTYTEAFHVPFVAWDGIHIEKRDGIFSDMDSLGIIKQMAGVDPEAPASARQNVLCEYGGPGCPDIGVKPIWYTYIDNHWRISAECSLTNAFTVDCVKEIYDIQKDPSQCVNLLKFRRNSLELCDCYEVIRDRHNVLRERFAGENFLREQLKILSVV